MDWLIIVGVGLAGFVLGWIARANRGDSSGGAEFNKVQRGAIMPNLSPTTPPTPATAAPAPARQPGTPAAAEQPAETSGNWSSIDPLIRKGKKIEAIKAYRQATSAGLKEAKDAVEARERELKRAP